MRIERAAFGMDRAWSRLVLFIPLVVVATAAWLLGGFLALLGPAAMALIVGVSVQALRPITANRRQTYARIGTRLLQVSIVLLGASTGLVHVLTVAGDSLPVMLTTVFGGLTAIWLVGSRLGVPKTTRGLLAAGTSICGASAIAAAAPALGATALEVSYAVSVVFIFNFAAIVLFPLIGHLAGMSSAAYGVWAGTAVNDTSSVLAASLAFGSATVATATVVKLSRTMMILPVTMIIAIVTHAADSSGSHPSLSQVARRAVPWFAVWFVVAASLNSVGVVPDSWGILLRNLASLGVVGALAAVGLSTDASAIRRAGGRPLALAAIGWAFIACLSIVVQFAVGSISQ